MSKNILRFWRCQLLFFNISGHLLVFIALFLTGSCVKVNAQEYPFNLPNTVKASFNVQTTSKESFNNKLLGYNIQGFDTKVQQDFIKLVDPVTIRFPNGVWANFYEWETDGYQQDSYDNKDHQDALDIFVKSVKGEIGGIAELNEYKKAINNDVGYDMMWTYSINFDDGPSSVARAKKDIGLGLEVKAIELGNEHFWKGQRANRTATEADYLREASAVSAALKAEFKDIQLSIPLGWRRSQSTYNSKIIGDGNYFDAVTVHKYLGADPDIPGESNDAYSALLTAKLELADDVNWVRDNYAPGKPIWLTEWGVSAGSDVHGAACLGMADAYLYMSENQDVFQRANWFSFNRVLNAMVVIGDNREPKYPLQKRGYLSTYQVLHDVLRDATLLKGNITTSAQLTSSKGSVGAVNARAVIKNDKTSVVAINLTNKPIVFELKFDNKIYTGGFKHEALVFDDLGVVAPVDFYLDPLELIKKGTGTITLPPLSINKITNIVLDSSVKVIEGSIEAEEYKNGGQGVGYSDTTTDNTLVSGIDTNGVDVGTMNTVTYVGDTQNGEWLKYDISVLSAGYYDFEFIYATQSSGTLLGVEVGGHLLFDDFLLPVTGTEDDFEKVIKQEIYLNEGLQELKLNIKKGGFNLDKINLKYVNPIEAPVFVKPISRSTLSAGEDIEVEVTSSLNNTEIKSVELLINNVSVRMVTSSPFTWGFDNQNDTMLEDMNVGDYELKVILTNNENRTSEALVTVKVSNFPTLPYGGESHQVPGVIQFEDYDLGGEGLAFSDSSVGNSGGVYRTKYGEDVDVLAGGSGFVVGSLSGDEFTRYTINVTEDGKYEMLVNFKTFAATSKPFSAYLLPRDLSSSIELFYDRGGSSTSGIKKVTVDDVHVFSDYRSVEFDLTAGVWVLELKIPNGGAGPSYDYITLNRTGSLGINDINSYQNRLKVYPVPSNDGIFNLNKSQVWAVYSITGKILLRGEGSLINISNFLPGFYFLKTESGVMVKLIYN